MYQKIISIFNSFSKKQMVIIETNFCLILIPDDDPGNDDEISSQISFYGFYEESKYFDLLVSVVCSHVLFMLFI